MPGMIIGPFMNEGTVNPFMFFNVVLQRQLLWHRCSARDPDITKRISSLVSYPQGGPLVGVGMSW